MVVHSMKVEAPFGFVTGCHAGDKFFVQATLASINTFVLTFLFVWW